MCWEPEPETKEETKVSGARKNKSLARKIAEAVIMEFGIQQVYDEDFGDYYVTPEQEKALAKTIKRVIRKHDAGK